MYLQMKPLTQMRVHSRLLEAKSRGGGRFAQPRAGWANRWANPPPPPIAELTLIAYLLHFFEHVVADVLAWREMFQGHRR